MNNKNKKTKSSGGFTLMEMLIVVAIIAILIAIAIPTFTSQLSKAKEAACLANRRSMLAVLKTDAMMEDYETLEDAYNAKTAAESGWAKQFTCPADGKITVKGNEISCSKHNKDEDRLPDFVGNIPVGDVNSLEAIKNYYAANGNSLPSVSSDSELWEKLFGSNKLFKNPSTLYWRPSKTVDKFDGEYQYVMFLSASDYPENGGNVQASWSGYACYYNGSYYVSTKKNGAAVDNSSVAGIKGDSVEQWLLDNHWEKVQ